MSKYVLLTSLTDEGTTNIKENPAQIRAINENIRELGAEIVDQYALLGPYDFLTVIEAENNETVAKVSVEIGTRLNAKSQTLAAIPISEFIEGID